MVQPVSPPYVPNRLSPADGAVFAPSAPPLLRGFAQYADRAFALLWTNEDRLVWVREMTKEGATSWFNYQMVVGTTDEAKTWTFSAGVSGGTVRFRYHDVVTDAVPFVNSAAFATRVRDAFVRHVDFSDASNLNVTYNTTTRVLTITFTNGRGRLDINDISVINNLTGTSPTVSGSTLTAGSGDVPRRNSGAGKWRWSMIGYNSDTLLYSGGFKTQREARASIMSSFYLDTTPVVTFDSGTNNPTPGITKTVTVTQVPFSWSISSSMPVTYQEINLVDDATDEQVDIMPGAGVMWATTDGEVQSYTLPYQRIANTKTYRWSFRARTDSGLTAFYTGSITVAFSPPGTLSSATLTFPPVGNNTYATLTWPQSGDSEFVDYVVRVRKAGVAFESRYNRAILQITDKTVLSANTFEYPFSTDIIFSIVQRATRAGVIIESAPKEWAVRVPYTGITINNMTIPRKSVQFPAHTGRTISGNKVNQYLESWFDAKAVGLSKRGAGYLVAFTAKLMGDYPDDPRQQWEDVKEFYENTKNDTYLYRDEFGEALYIMLDKPTLGYEGGGVAGTIDIGATEVRYTPIDLNG